MSHASSSRPWSNRCSEYVCHWAEALLAKGVRNRRWIRQALVQVPNLKAFMKLSEAERLRETAHWPNELAEGLARTWPDQENWTGKNYLSFLNPQFPADLEKLRDPPCGLYFKGSWKILRQRGPWIAVVGTRRASAFALSLCQQMVRDMACYRPVIVSGMARGIDAAAHQAALDSGLSTVGILGTDINRVYPRENLALFQRMAEAGLLLSEIPATAEQAAWRFPERNRLIAALSEAIVVVEAPLKSGALTTALEGLELGKEIFAVPGKLGEANAGCHRLIQQGAHLLTEAKEIFQVLGYRKKIPSEPKAWREPFTADETRILTILKEGRAQIDKIAYVSQLAPATLAVSLTSLVLRGVLQEYPGKLFEIIMDF